MNRITSIAFATTALHVYLKIASNSCGLPLKTEGSAVTMKTTVLLRELPLKKDYPVTLSTKL